MTDLISAKRHFPRDFAADKRGVYVSDGLPDLPYSDGAISERRMLSQLAQIKDRSTLSPELRELQQDWPSTYHFSPRRANLLRPFIFPPASRILEVGAGCGALSRYLGESGLEIVGLEGSYRRACIAQTRTEDLANVKIVCAQLDDVDFGDTYDVVVAVGLLEYAAVYQRTQGDSHRQLLERLLELLNPGGILLLAIENRLGIKYVAGAAEDHTGHPYQGVDDAYELRGPRTFDLSQLHSLLSDSGFAATELFTPLPDYKLVRSVVRTGSVPLQASSSIAQIVASSFYEDPQHTQVPPYSLELLGDSYTRNGLAGTLGNSFLVAAGRERSCLTQYFDEGTFAWYFAVDRRLEFTKATTLHASSGGIDVHRYSLASQRGEVSRSRGVLTQTLVSEPFREGTSVWLDLVSAINKADWSPALVAAAISDWYVTLSGLGQSNKDGIPMVEGAALDATPFNAMRTGRQIAFFDIEWLLADPVPLAFVAVRALLFSLDMITSCAQPSQETPTCLGELSEAILSELGGTLPASPQYDFLDWLATIQADATGLEPKDTLTRLSSLWSRSLPVRDRPARIDILENR